MPAIQSLGVGSGLDANSIITQLLAIERQPLVRLQQQAKDVQTQISAWGTLQSKVDALGSSADTLADADTWLETSVNLNGSDALVVTASGSAEPIELDIAVTALAQRQSIASQAFANAATTVGSGTLTIQLGSWTENFGDFTADAGTASVDVTISPGSDTLADIRDAINAANAGVTASVLNDASGSRLVIRSDATGEENGFQITSADAGLQALVFDEASVTSQGVDPEDPGYAPYGFTPNVRATNLQATLNGAAVSSASNTMTNVLDGITIQALKPTEGTDTVAIARDVAGMKTQVEGFVAAYNDLMGFIRQQTAYNAETQTAATLQGDRVAISIQNQVRSGITTDSGASAVFARLSAVGIELQANGTLQINGGKLDDAMATNLAEVATLFSRDEAAAADDGVARRLVDLVDQLTATDGAVANRRDGLNQRLQRNQDDQERLDARLSQVEARLQAQYTALDRQMATLTGLNQYVSQQMQMLSKSNSG
jgi:flagellar hook-associated protein 2